MVRIEDVDEVRQGLLHEYDELEVNDTMEDEQAEMLEYDEVVVWVEQEELTRIEGLEEMDELDCKIQYLVLLYIIPEVEELPRMLLRGLVLTDEAMVQFELTDLLLEVEQLTQEAEEVVQDENPRTYEHKHQVQDEVV